MVTEKNTPAYYGYELRKCSYAEYQQKLKRKENRRRLAYCIHQLKVSLCQFVEAFFSPEVISVFGIIGMILFLLASS